MELGLPAGLGCICGLQCEQLGWLVNVSENSSAGPPKYKPYLVNSTKLASEACQENNLA